MLGSAAARDRGTSVGCCQPALWGPCGWQVSQEPHREGRWGDTYGGCQGGVGEREALQVGHKAAGDDAAGGDGLGRRGGDCRV